MGETKSGLCQWKTKEWCRKLLPGTRGSSPLALPRPLVTPRPTKQTTPHSSSSRCGFLATRRPRICRRPLSPCSLRSSRTNHFSLCSTFHPKSTRTARGPHFLPQGALMMENGGGAPNVDHLKSIGSPPSHGIHLERPLHGWNYFLVLKLVAHPTLSCFTSKGHCMELFPSICVLEATKINNKYK